MPAASIQPWVYSTLALLVAAAALVALYFALFHGRPRGRRRCPRCWYDMAGVPGFTCPECGRAARRERDFRRTRRSPRLAVLGLALFLAATVTPHVPDIRARGWPAALPDPVLIAMMPLAARESSWRGSYSGSGFGYTLHQEINARLGFSARSEPSTRRLGPVDRRAMAWLCIWLGDPDRLTLNQDIYASALASLAMADAVPRRAWHAIWRRVAEHSILCRPSWPGDEALRVELQPSGWFYGRVGSIPPRDPPLRRISFARDLSAPAAPLQFQRILAPLSPLIVCRRTPDDWSDSTIEFGPAAHPLAARITLEEQTPRGEWVHLWTGSARIPTTPVRTVDEALPPVRSPGLDAALAAAVRIAITGDCVDLWMDPLPDAGLAATTLGLRVRFLDEGEEIAHARCWTRPHVADPGRGRIAWGLSITGDTDAAAAADFCDPRWRIEISADPEMALRDLRAASRWDGAFTLPANSITRHVGTNPTARFHPPP